MRIYLISQDENNGYDTYDSMVVCAKSKKDAKKLHPEDKHSWDDPWSSWASSPDNVSAEYLGKASIHLKVGVICASFNAG